MHLKSRFVVSLLVVDFVTVMLALFVSYFFRGSDFALTFLAPVADNYLESIVFFKYSFKFYALFLFSAVVVGLYKFNLLESFVAQLKALIKTLFVALSLLVFYYFFKRTFVFSRFVILMTFCLVFALILCSRFVFYKYYKYLQRTKYQKSLVVFCDSAELLNRLLASKKVFEGFACLGYFADKNLKVNLKYLGKFNSESKKHCSYLRSSILQLGNLQSDLESWLLDRARYNQLEYFYVSHMQAFSQKLLDLQSRFGLQSLHLTQTTIYQWPGLFKRLFDVIVSGLLLIVFVPVWLLVPILIKLDSRGDVLFKYLDDGSVVKRVGFRGQLFYMLKYRTMRPKSHDMRYEQLSNKNSREDSPLVKITDDPRVTKLGKFLRRYDIDELPQLWNVFKGDMSLVGPRPHLPEEVSKYKKHHNFVFTVKPGITGLSQVSGRCKLDFEKEVELDTYYIENWSLWLDIKILFRTLKVVLSKNNS